MNLKEKFSWMPSEQLEGGMYEEAAKEGKSFGQWLEDHKAKQMETPYAGLTQAQMITKRMQLRAEGKNAPANAVEELLGAFDIKAFDPIQKVYQYSGSTVLFPEIIAQQVYAGALKGSLVSTLVASDTVIRGINFHKVYISDTEPQRQMSKVGIGEEIPMVRITVSKESITLQKFGKRLGVAYEEVELVPLNLFSVTLDRIGMQMGMDETDDMIYTVINGDGNSNTPGTTVTSDTSGSIVLADAIEWSTCLPTPYVMTDFVGKKALLNDYYLALLGVGVNNPPQTYAAVGITLPTAHEWDRSVVTTDRFFGLDKRYAIARVTTGATVTESAKIISKQLNETTVSYRSGFHIIDKNAVAIFDQTH